jgi:AmmeMemoRadiSam system protein B
VFKLALPLLAASVLFFAGFPADIAGLAPDDPAPSYLRSPFERIVELAVRSYSGQGAKDAQNTEYDKNAENDKRSPRVLGGIAPHHDLALPMIVRFYDRLASSSRQGRDVGRVWLFSPDHFHRVRHLAAICDEDWALSSGTLEADGEACGALGAMRDVEANSGAKITKIFGAEHGITLHIPLIARYFPNARVVPILVNPKAPDIGLLILRNKILELFRDGDIIILSMDLSHYKTPEAMAVEDSRTLPVLENLHFLAAGGLDVDARRAAALVLMLFKDMGAGRGEILERMDSSDILGRRVESGTSYATAVYSQSGGIR